MDSQGSHFNSSSDHHLLDSQIDQFLARDPEETDSSPSEDDWEIDISEADSAPGDPYHWDFNPEASFYDVLSEGGSQGTVMHHLHSGNSFTARRWNHDAINATVSADEAIVPLIPVSAIHCNNLIDGRDYHVVNEHEDIPYHQTVHGQDTITISEQDFSGQHVNEHIVPVEDAPNEHIVPVEDAPNEQIVYQRVVQNRQLLQVGVLNEQIVDIQEDSDNEQIINFEDVEDEEFVTFEDFLDEQVVNIQEEDASNDQVVLAQGAWLDERDEDNEPFQFNQVDGQDFGSDYDDQDHDLSDYVLPSEDSGYLGIEIGDHSYADVY